jgi:hypothetical protein
VVLPFSANVSPAANGRLDPTVRKAFPREVS